jgi:DNA polymerase III sliding clamp (beta) subunit (PCNA family)
LEVASLALKETSKEPIYTHFLVQIDANSQAKIKANNKFLFCEAGLQIEEGDEGKMTIPGGPLKELAKRVTDGPITFELKDDETVEITSGRAVLRFPSLPSEEFLIPEKTADDAKSETHNLVHMLEALQYMKVFIGQDKDKAHYMVTELRNGHWMASDGVRIGMYEREGLEGDITIQTQSLGSVLAFLKASDGQAVQVTGTDQFFWFGDGVNLLAYRRTDQTFSKEIEKILGNVEAQDHVKVNRDLLEPIILRLKIALEGGNTRMEFGLSAGDEGANLEVKTVNSKGKSSIEILQVNRESGEGDVGFALDWRPLLDVVQSEQFAAGVVDLLYVPQMSIVKLLREDEGVRATGLIALREG